MTRVALLLAGLAALLSGQPAYQSALDRILSQSKVVVGGGAPLKLEDVLDSVEKHYPPLLAILQDRAIADADLLSAQGRFDLTLRARADADRLGFYSNERFDVGIDQPFAFQGMSVSSGYRLGEGQFASYDGKLETRSLGEVRTGLRLPLLRDRSTDFRRAEVQKANWGIRIADLGIDQQKIAINQLATRRYWDWVAAGRRYAVAAAVLEIATQREKILEESVKAGQIAAIEVTDNKRAILQRQTLLVESRRALEQTAFELSLFLRDDRGQALTPSVDRVPPAFPDSAEFTDAKLAEDALAALRRRPEIARLIAQREQTEVDARLAKNQRLPMVDLITAFSTEAGSGPVKRGPQEFRTSLVFELPFQRRTAIGRFNAAQARLRALREREKFARDQVDAEVKDAASAVNAAQQRVIWLRDEVQVSRELEDAERTRFDLGEGTLFVLNLRELTTAEAAIREIVAQADYQRAVAQYELAIASGLPIQP